MKQSLAQLNYKHPTYVSNSKAWKEITELYELGESLESNKRHYLPQRPGEPLDIYKLRLQKATFNPILTKSINTLVNKLSTGSLDITNSDDPFWVRFRNDLDLKGSNDDKFIQNLFREILLYGRVYCHIDKTVGDFTPRNRKEELEQDIRPYITTYNATQVLDWGKEGYELEFIKTKQESIYRETPFSEPLIKTKWSIITKEVVATYVIYNKVGTIDYTDIKGNLYDSVILEEGIEPLSIIEHGVGHCPVKLLELNPELWVTNLVLSKLKEEIRISNNISDASDIGCQLQRTYKPYKEPTLDTNAFIAEEESPFVVGNTSVIKVEKYEIVESTGTALTTSRSLLQDIHQQIAMTLTMKSLRTNSDTDYEASGNSKRFDYVEQEAALINYGIIIREFYQSILDTVAMSQGILTVPKVNGLTSFKFDTSSELLLIAQGLLTVSHLLPELALKMFSYKFSSFLMDTNDPDLLNKLEQEIELKDFKELEARTSSNNSIADINQASVPMRTTS